METFGFRMVVMTRQIFQIILLVVGLNVVLAGTAGELAAIPYPSVPLPVFQVADGPCQTNWASIAKQYRCPEWFRDAKLGFWAHWTPQCVFEKIATVALLGSQEQLKWHADPDALVVSPAAQWPCDHAVVFAIQFANQQPVHL